MDNTNNKMSKDKESEEERIDRLNELQNQWANEDKDENGFVKINTPGFIVPIVRRELSEEKKEKVSEEFNMDKILLDPNYAKSLGIIVYVRVEDNGDKYAVLSNGQEEVELKLKQNKDK